MVQTKKPTTMKLAGSRHFGPFKGDDKKKALIDAFLEKKGGLSVEDVSELRTLPFAVRVSVFCAWVRKNKDEGAVETLDALWAVSKMEESGEKSSKIEDDPLLEVFEPQQTKTADVYDLLQLCLFGSSALQDKERLMRFVESPSNRFRDAAITELFKSGLMEAKDIEKMFGELEERALRSLVSACVRHKQTAVLEPMFPEKTLAKLGAPATIRLLHAFPTGSEVVRFHIDALTVDPTSQADNFSARKRKTHAKQNQLTSFSGCFWDEMWKFHSVAMLDVLHSQLKGAKDFNCYQNVWNAWSSIITRLVNGTERSVFTIKTSSPSSWNTGVIFEKLFRLYYLEFPPYNATLTQQTKERLLLGNYTLLEAFQGYRISIANNAPYTNLGQRVPVQSLSNIILDLLRKNTVHLLNQTPCQRTVEDFLFHKSYLPKLSTWCSWLKVQKKERRSTVEVKEKFLYSLMEMLAPLVPGKDIYSGNTTTPKLQEVYIIGFRMIESVSLSLAMKLYPFFKSMNERSLPSSEVLGLFPSKLPASLFKELMPNKIRKHYVSQWAGMSYSNMTTCLMAPLKAVFNSLRKTPVTEKKAQAILEVADLLGSEIAWLLRNLNELTIKDPETEARRLDSLLAGKEKWVARSKEILKYIETTFNDFESFFSSGSQTYFPLKEKVRLHVSGIVAQVFLPFLRDYTKDLKSENIAHHRAQKHMKIILRILRARLSSTSELPIFHSCAEIGELVQQWIDSFPKTSTFTFHDLRNPLACMFQAALGPIEDSPIAEQKTELRIRYLKLHLWAAQHFKRDEIERDARLPHDQRTPRIAQLTFDQLVSFISPLSNESKAIVFTEPVVDELIKYVHLCAEAALDPKRKRLSPSHRIFGLLPESVLPKVRGVALPLFEEFVEHSVREALESSKSNPDLVRQNKSLELLNAYPKNLSHAIVKKMSQKEGGVLTSSDIRHLVLSLSLPITDEWVYSEVKALSRSSIVSQKHEALSHLFSKAWETGDSDLFIRSFKFIIEQLRNDSPGSRLKLLAQLNESLVRKLKKDFDRATKIFRCDSEDGTYPDTQLWLDLVLSILQSPETESKKQLLVRVESFAAVLIKCAMKSFARCCVENHTKGKPMGDYSPAQKSLFNLAAEIKWRTRTFLVGDKKANETFEIALGRIYKEMEGTKETKIHATTRSLELVLGVYTHYVGKFWEDTSRLSSSFYTRVRSLFDICWGHPNRHPVYTQIVESLCALTKNSRIPNPESLVSFMTDTAHCGLPKWKKNDSLVRTFIESALFSPSDTFDFSRDELLGMWLKMTLPYSKGSKAGRSRPTKTGKKPTKKERELYLNTRVEMIRKMLEASPSAIHVKMVWSFLVRHRQDLLLPFLQEAQQSVFDGPFYDLNKKSLIASLEGESYSDDEGCSDSEGEDEGDENEDTGSCFLLPASYGLRRLPPPCVRELANLLELMFLSPNNPVLKRAKYAHSYARLPCVSFSELLPIMQRAQSEGQSLPPAVVDELITVSLTSDEPKSPYLFLFSEEVLKKTDDRVLLRVVNAAMVAVDASNNPSHLARMVKGLLCPPGRRKALSSATHRIVLRLLKNDPTPATYEHLIWELEQKSSNATIKTAALSLILEFLSRSDIDDKAVEPLFVALENHTKSSLLHILAEEAASFLSVLPEIKGSTYNGGDVSRKQNLIRCLPGNLSQIAIHLAPLISKAENVSLPSARAARYFRNILFPMYCRDLDQGGKGDADKALWESSLANPATFKQWKECFVFYFDLWSMLPEVQAMIAEESYKMVLLCAPSPVESVVKSPPVGAQLVEGFQEGKKDLIVRVLCENLVQLPFLESSLKSGDASSQKPILDLATYLATLCQTTPISQHKTLKYILKIFGWSFKLSLAYTNEDQKKLKFAVLLKLEEIIQPLLTTLSLFQKVSGEDSSSVSSAIRGFENLFKTAKDDKKKRDGQGRGSSSGRGGRGGRGRW